MSGAFDGSVLYESVELCNTTDMQRSLWATYDKLSPKPQSKCSKPSNQRYMGKSSTTSENECPRSSAVHSTDVGFLFVVNEINLNLDVPPTADRWGNLLPPSTWRGFEQESVGQVFRYRNGKVDAANEYYWHRQQLGLPGSIERYDAGYDGSRSILFDELGLPVPDWHEVEEYSTTTIFNCGPFLPFVLGHGDPSVRDHKDFNGWRALHFTHKKGISQASLSGSHKVVAGPNVSFIDGLLPRAYENHSRNQPKSRGLGGEIGVLIGLMGLSQGRGMIDTAFHSRAWDENCWTGYRHASAWPAVNDDPRGVIVHIALDPEAGRSSSVQAISNFEWCDVAIAG